MTKWKNNSQTKRKQHLPKSSEEKHETRQRMVISTSLIHTVIVLESLQVRCNIICILITSTSRCGLSGIQLSCQRCSKSTQSCLQEASGLIDEYRCFVPSFLIRHPITERFCQSALQCDRKCHGYCPFSLEKLSFSNMREIVFIVH